MSSTGLPFQFVRFAVAMAFCGAVLAVAAGIA